MPRFVYVVEIETDTQEHADEVCAERIGHDEDYGFDYTIRLVKGTGTVAYFTEGD